MTLMLIISMLMLMMMIMMMCSILEFHVSQRTRHTYRSYTCAHSYRHRHIYETRDTERLKLRRRQTPRLRHYTRNHSIPRHFYSTTSYQIWFHHITSFDSNWCRLWCLQWSWWNACDVMLQFMVLEAVWRCLYLAQVCRLIYIWYILHSNYMIHVHIRNTLYMCIYLCCVLDGPVVTLRDAPPLHYQVNTCTCTHKCRYIT